MALIDELYKEIVEDIIENGTQDEPSVVRAKWESDGSPATTVSLLDKQIKFDNSGDECGLMTTKFVAPKNPLKEILWIWQKKSNDVEVLEAMGCKVWSQWKIKEEGEWFNTIGKAYGYQLANKKRRVVVDKLMLDMILNGELSFAFDDMDNIKWFMDLDVMKKEELIGRTVEIDQVDWLLYNLKHPTKRYSRRLATTLWCVEDLDEMALEPCAYESRWYVKKDKHNRDRLNLIVKIRSNDMALGNPYNIFQYSILHRMIAQVTGIQTGDITFKIDDAHVYERHIEGLKEQLARPALPTATVTLNSNITSFYDFTLDDIVILNYEYSGKSKYEVAV